jgi:hypothetical protein
MARYKPYSYDQTKLIPVSYDRQDSAQAGKAGKKVYYMAFRH